MIIFLYLITISFCKSRYGLRENTNYLNLLTERQKNANYSSKKDRKSLALSKKKVKKKKGKKE